MKNRINYHIEEDGTVSFQTEDFSPEHHEDADKFLKVVEELLGGETERKVKKGHLRHHHHVHGKRWNKAST